MDSDTKNKFGRDLTGSDFAGYRVGAKIGAGGYAWVFRATDVELDRDIALKILTPRRGGYPEALRKRFHREAKLVARLRDPRSIKLISHGEEDGLLYIAFEFIEGESLDKWLEAGEPMSALRVAKILEQVLESLSDAHDLGIVHRDIKPGNIMLYKLAGRADQVKVLDFGIGKIVDQKVSMELTMEGGWMGTPKYMAPDQLRGEEVSASSDLYAVGLVAYELLTGERAIKSKEAMEAIAEIASEEDIVVPDWVEAPKGLVDVVNKMLRKDKESRYSSAVDVLDDLQSFRMRTGDYGTVPGSGTQTLIGVGRLQRVGVPVVIGLVVLAVFALIGFGVSERSEASDTEALLEELAQNSGASVVLELEEREEEGSSKDSSVSLVEPEAPEEPMEDQSLRENDSIDREAEPETTPALREAVRPTRRPEQRSNEREERVQVREEVAAPVDAPVLEEEPEEEVTEPEEETRSGGPTIWSVD